MSFAKETMCDVYSSSALAIAYKNKVLENEAAKEVKDVHLSYLETLCLTIQMMQWSWLRLLTCFEYGLETGTRV